MIIKYLKIFQLSVRYSSTQVPKRLLPCKVNLIKSLTGTNCDALLCIDKNSVPKNLIKSFDSRRSFDKAFDKEVSVFKDDCCDVPLVYAPVGELTDYHDVRAYQKAAGKALSRAIKAGFKNPAFILPNSINHNSRFSNLTFCTALGALHELYVPIQYREDVPDKKERIESLSFVVDDPKSEEQAKNALEYESGKFIARDIGGGDPERMTPKNIEKYVKPIFNNSIKVEVIDDVEVLKKEYPLFAAVNRAAAVIDRHQGRIVFLEYTPKNPASKTLMLVGKGVTYDTGGADIKAGGIMAGMSRDKCGAAAVAGFMQVVQQLQPNVNVFAALCLARNSVGEECYVADEILVSRAGVRMRVNNTDAEGRLLITDALCRMKEIALERNLPDPHLFTIATLTGHAVLTVGDGYTIVVDNSVARNEGHDIKLAQTGDSFGDPFHISNLRQDDFEFNVKGKGLGEDLLQCNRAASGRTPRGHQFPAAFMIVASGLDKHGLNSKKPFKYTHLDIAASSGNVPHTPTAAPLVALAKTHLGENVKV